MGKEISIDETRKSWIWDEIVFVIVYFILILLRVV